MIIMSYIPILIDTLSAMLRISTPLIFAALGGMFSERSGVQNIALEGIILVGALAGVVATYYSNNPWIGMIMAGIIGGLVALLHAWLCIDAHSNQIISGTALNILAAGATSYLLLVIWGQAGYSPSVEKISPIEVAILKDIPMIGKIFKTQNLITYIALILVPLSNYFMFRTVLGLRLRAIGEYPRAVDSLGINVQKYRYLAVVTSGILAGLAGAYLSITQVAGFVELMANGRGFIALAAVIFGRWRPYGLLVACLLFGFSDSLQWVLQVMGVNVPSQLLLSLPYILTLVVVSTAGKKSESPAAIGEPYYEEGE